MMRLLLFCTAGLLVLAACGKQPLFATLPSSAQHALGADTSRFVVVLPAKAKNSQITVQLGAGNQAAATGTDNTGRAASQGANGGQATITQRGGGVFPLVLLGLASAVGGWFLNDKWRAWRGRPG